MSLHLFGISPHIVNYVVLSVLDGFEKINCDDDDDDDDDNDDIHILNDVKQ